MQCHRNVEFLSKQDSLKKKTKEKSVILTRVYRDKNQNFYQCCFRNMASLIISSVHYHPVTQ